MIKLGEWGRPGILRSMARYRKPFTLFPRSLPSGLVVYYYQTRDDTGRRLPARSTGCTDRAAAERYCMELWRDGKLVPTRNPFFREFAAGFWGPSSPYVRYHNATAKRPMSDSHLRTESGYLANRVMPHFRDYRVQDIRRHHVEAWVASQSEEVSKATVSHLLRNLRAILNYAKRQGLIRDNPADGVKVAESYTPRGTFSTDEIRRIFAAPFNHPATRALSFTACVTGARLTELRELTTDRVHDDWIRIAETGKTAIRDVPVPKTVISAILALQVEPYAISYDGTIYPPWDATKKLYEAMRAAGISDKERRERSLVFHSWRHTFISYCRAEGVPDAMIKHTVGHSQQGTTGGYTHFSLVDLGPIRRAQEAIIRLMS